MEESLPLIPRKRKRWEIGFPKGEHIFEFSAQTGGNRERREFTFSNRSFPLDGWN